MSFKVCIKDSQGMSKSHDPVTVDYAIVGGTLLLYSAYSLISNICLSYWFVLLSRNLDVGSNVELKK